MNNSISIVNVIQLMLAPGLMISACGLLLLSMNNKYSLVVNRIRLLNEERRKLVAKIDKEFKYQENTRMESLSVQIHSLAYRAKLVRNAVLSYSIAVGLFILTSLLIGIEYFSDTEKLSYFITALFLLGMVSVFLGVIFASYETIKGYEIIQFEVKTEE
ncbi:MAG: DUF2721 domain-containing protein [Ignavibacteriaceae bacterium]